MEQTKLVNLDLSATKGTKIQVNGDPDSSFTLNLSDFGIYNRLKDGLGQLYEVFASMKTEMGEIAQNSDSEVDASIDETLPDETGVIEEDEEKAEANSQKLIEAMREADIKMRGIVDYIFSAPVSEVCAPDGYMFDLFEGQLRFEYIINAITKLYANNINAEYFKLKSRINSKLPHYVTGK